MGEVAPGCWSRLLVVRRFFYNNAELGLRRVFRGIFFGPLLFFRSDGVWGGLVGFEGFFDAAIGGLPDLVRVGVVDFFGGVHAPGQALGIGVNQFDSYGAFVGGVGVQPRRSRCGGLAEEQVSADDLATPGSPQPPASQNGYEYLLRRFQIFFHLLHLFRPQFLIQEIGVFPKIDFELFIAWRIMPSRFGGYTLLNLRLLGLQLLKVLPYSSFGVGWPSEEKPSPYSRFPPARGNRTDCGSCLFSLRAATKQLGESLGESLIDIIVQWTYSDAIRKGPPPPG